MLSYLIDFLSGLRLYTIVHSGYSALRYRKGVFQEQVDPGLHWRVTWKFPFFDDFQIYSSNEFPVVTDEISVEDAKGEVWLLSVTVVCRIVDGQKALIDRKDLSESISEKAISGASSLMGVSNGGNRGVLCETITKLIELEDYGVEVIQVSIPNLVRHKVYRILGSQQAVVEE